MTAPDFDLPLVVGAGISSSAAGSGSRVIAALAEAVRVEEARGASDRVSRN